VGLYHFAYELGSIEEIKVAYQVVQDKGVRVAGFGDHGNIKGLYILDPDGIEIELYAVAPECEGIPLQEILTSIAV
jgi:catechol-2,3-dioxygenase